jgi:hypothetical protein
MKNITLKSFLALGLVSVVLLGCLKDKGFENYEYGINDPDTQPPGVGFPLAANKKNTVGLNVQSTLQAVDDIVFLNLNTGNVAPTDIDITLRLDSSIVRNYNTQNAASILVLNYSLFSVGTTVRIPAGARNAQIPINVPSTLMLNPNASYGVGIRIEAVSGNYQIASNLRELMVEFTIKNRYDGRYNLRGYHNRTSPDYSAPYNVSVNMITTGPNSVTMFWPAVNLYASPIAGGTGYYGTFTKNFIFNLSTNDMTGWDWTPYPTTLPTTVGPGSRYDAPNKIIYFYGWYNNNPSARAFFDTLRFLGPR